MSIDDALLATPSGYFGYVLGGIVLAGVLPGLFAYYGKRNAKSWALSLGWALALMLGAGGLMGGAWAGTVLGFGLFLAIALGIRPKAP